MKKLLILVVILFCTSMLSALDLQKSAGLTVNANYYNWTYEWGDNSSSNGYLYTMIGIEAFFDLTYLRTGLSYNSNMGKMDTESTVDDTTSSTEVDYSMSTLDMFLVGKYPVKVNKFDVWPALGIGYSKNIEYKDENDKDVEDTDLDDLYLLLMMGADYTINSNVYATASLDFGYNLNPKTNTGDSNEDDWSGYKSSIKLGAGYRF